MKNLGLIILIVVSAFALFSCQKDSPAVDNPEDGFIEKGNLLINSNPAQLAARISYKNDNSTHCG